MSKTKKEMIDYEAEFDRIYQHFLIRENENLKKVQTYDQFQELFIEDYLEGRTPNRFQDRIMPRIYSRYFSTAQKERITTVEFKPVRRGTPKRVITKRVLDKPARVRGKIVYAEMTRVKIRNREFVRYRDARGRFAGVVR